VANHKANYIDLPRRYSGCLNKKGRFPSGSVFFLLKPACPQRERQEEESSSLVSGQFHCILYSMSRDVAKTYRQVMYYRWKNPKARAWWHLVRVKVLERAGWRCEHCGAIRGRKKALHIHHLTYKHLFHEDKHLNDLIVLCDYCHRKEHGLLFHQKVIRSIYETITRIR
jgi:hypothetical protein